MTVEALLSAIATFFQVVLIDIALAGDNAVVIGMAAASLPAAYVHEARKIDARAGQLATPIGGRPLAVPT